MLPGDEYSQLRSGRIGSYRRTVQSRKPKAKKRGRKSDAQSPYQLEERLKKIFVTREVYTRSEHTETPPRKLFGGVRLNRSATRIRASDSNIPSPPPPSSRASTIPQTSAVATMDGLQFREDPRFRPWHRSIIAGTRDNASIGAFENDIGAQERVLPYKAVSDELLPGLDSSESFVEGDPPAPRERRRLSADSHSDDFKRLSCAPLQLQTNGIGRSASLFKTRIAQKVWLGKSLKARLRSSIPEDIAQIQEPGRIAIPRQITTGRRLRAQKKSENLRDSGGIEGEGSQSYVTLRLVTTDVEEPRSKSAYRDPELTAMLHDPNQNRFSDSWEKFYEEQTQGIVREQEQTSAGMVLPSNIDPASRASPPAAISRSFADGPALIARYGGHLQERTAGLTEVQTMPAPPIIRITESKDEGPKLIAPNPGPRTSSKGGGIFSKFMGPGKIPPPVSPPVNRARPSNISKPRKASESSILTITDYENGGNPVYSTDTLAKIEVELQSSPSRHVHTIAANVSTRKKNLSIDSGPSGCAPDRELPQLPGDGASEESRSGGSSRNRHVRKNSSISIGHARNNLSASSISTVRAISPSKTGSAGGHSRRVSSEAPQRVLYGHINDQVAFDHPVMRHSEALHPGHSTNVPEYGSLPVATQLFLRKQHEKAARAESRRIIKQRDMALNGVNGPIEEETESDTISPLSQPVDPLDKFPNPPESRPGSRTSARRTRSTQRSQSAARRVPLRATANQTLSASRIVTIEDVVPATPNRRNSRRSPSSKSRASEIPLRDGAGTPIRQTAKSSLPKKTSQRSIRSHTSQSGLAPNGAHTPPSSDSCASDDEFALGGLHRLDLRREIQEIRGHLVIQGRTIDKLQKSVMLYMPTGRSRSRDLSLDWNRPLQQQLQLQVPPPAFRYPRMGGAQPGPVMIGDVVVEPMDGGRGFGAGGNEVEERRLSHAPLTVSMDNMVDQTFRGLG
jgi:hypothetical protein